MSNNIEEIKKALINKKEEEKTTSMPGNIYYPQKPGTLSGTPGQGGLMGGVGGIIPLKQTQSGALPTSGSLSNMPYLRSCPSPTNSHVFNSGGMRKQPYGDELVIFCIYCGEIYLRNLSYMNSSTALNPNVTDHANMSSGIEGPSCEAGAGEALVEVLEEIGELVE